MKVTIDRNTKWYVRQTETTLGRVNVPDPLAACAEAAPAGAVNKRFVRAGAREVRSEPIGAVYGIDPAPGNAYRPRAFKLLLHGQLVDRTFTFLDEVRCYLADHVDPNTGRRIT